MHCSAADVGHVGKFRIEESSSEPWDSRGTRAWHFTSNMPYLEGVTLEFDN